MECPFGRHRSEENVRATGSHARRVQFILVLLFGIALIAAGPYLRSNEVRDQLNERLLVELEQQHGWHIVVHGMDEISYLSQSDGKLKTLYSRFGDPIQSWMGFGSLRPDGRKLALVTEQSGHSFLTVYDIESRAQKAVLSRPYLFGPRWSPDGERIAFSCRSGATGNFDLDVYEVRTARTSQILAAELPSGEGYFDWSPDGKRIIYETHDDVIRIIDIQKKEEHKVGKGGSPRWSPDGKHISYQKDGEDAVVIQNMESGESRTILVGKNASPPIWSPNGRYITYTRPYGGPSKQLQDLSKLVDTHGDLWVMDIETNLEAKLFTANESIYPTYWGPIAQASPVSH